MSKQPEALRLAEDLDAYHTRSHHKEAAAELRRLHALNRELLEVLRRLNSAINFRSAAFIAGTDAKIAFADDMVWGAQDSVVELIAKAEASQ